MCSYADSEAKLSQQNVDFLEKAFSITHLGFQRKLVHREGTSWGSQLIKRLNDLPGEDGRHFSSQRCQYLQGLIFQVRKSQRAVSQASPVNQMNGQRQSSRDKSIHMELKKASELSKQQLSKTNPENTNTCNKSCVGCMKR